MWEVLRAAGLAVTPVDLDTDTRHEIGLPAGSSAQMSEMAGTFRTLVLRLGEGEPLREALQRTSRRLTSAAPHVLWLVGAVDATGSNAAIVAWSGADRAARVSSFAWEPEHVVDSDAETLCALAAIHEELDVALHARCLDVLGREALT
ncbi:MAG TPA: hypothetical protein VF483_13410, partial [Gemmatimonadaceae bacterium]